MVQLQSKLLKRKESMQVISRRWRKLDSTQLKQLHLLQRNILLLLKVYPKLKLIRLLMHAKRLSTWVSRLPVHTLKNDRVWFTFQLDPNHLINFSEVVLKPDQLLKCLESSEQERHKFAIHYVLLANFQSVKVVVKVWLCTLIAKVLSDPRDLFQLPRDSVWMNNKSLIT